MEEKVITRVIERQPLFHSFYTALLLTVGNLHFFLHLKLSCPWATWKHTLVHNEKKQYHNFIGHSSHLLPQHWQRIQSSGRLRGQPRVIGTNQRHQMQFNWSKSPLEITITVYCPPSPGGKCGPLLSKLSLTMALIT